MGFCERTKQGADGGEPEESDGGSSEVFEVLGEPAAAPEPSEGALDHPSLGQHLETCDVGTCDDLDLPVGDGGERRGDPRASIGGVADDLAEEWKQRARVLEERRGGGGGGGVGGGGGGGGGGGRGGGGG